MKKKGLEKNLVVLLFVLVLVVFSFAERDSRKLDRLYKTAQLLQKNKLSTTVQLQTSPAKTINN